MVGVAGGEPASVDVDLVVDELEVFLYLGELGGHAGQHRLAVADVTSNERQVDVARTAFECSRVELRRR